MTHNTRKCTMGLYHMTPTIFWQFMDLAIVTFLNNFKTNNVKRHGISDNIWHKEGQLLLPNPLVMGNDWDRREHTGKCDMKLSWQEIAAQIKHIIFLITHKYLLTFLKKCVNLILVFIAIDRRKLLVIKKSRFFTYFMTETYCCYFGNFP